MSTERERIEKAAEAFGGITSPSWVDAAEWERVQVLEGMRRAFAVFEKAHTSTDDERGELIAELRHAWGGTKEGEDFFGPQADMVLSWMSWKGFRRTVQGEPTDAQVQDALNAYYSVGGAWVSEKDNWVNQFAPNMRAALRAAGAVNGEPTASGPLNVERENAAAQYRELSGWSMSEGHAIHDAFVSGAEWERDNTRGPVQDEPDWEYGIRPLDDDVPLGVSPMPTYQAARVRADNIRGGWAIVRRLKAGPWVPVVDLPEGEEQ